MRQDSRSRANWDWPGDGPIDLDQHDLPHASSSTEWWYVNSHLVTADRRRWSVFAAFFRVVLEDDRGRGPLDHAHSMVCGLADIDSGRVFHGTLLDPRTPREALRLLDRPAAGGDPRLNRALREVFDAGTVPLPDRLLERDARVRQDWLFLDYGGNRFEKLADGSYRLMLAPPGGDFACDLVFTPCKPAIRHGDHGVVRGYSAESMFYYFIPRCGLDGVLTVDGVARPVTGGQGWYDHEFGFHERGRSAGGVEDGGSVSWNWIAAQLADGHDVSAYEIFDSARDDECIGRWAIVVGPNGERAQYESFSMTPERFSMSGRTFREYPVQWRLEVPDAGLCLTVCPTPPNHEVITLLSPPGFFEGSAIVRGTHRGTPVEGSAFIERTGFERDTDLDGFYRTVSRVTLQAAEQVIPRRPTAEEAMRMIAGDEFPTAIEGLDVDRFITAVIEPLHDMVARGGKAWRSFGLLICIELVGDDPGKYLDLLALPELIHTGSLIVDDIQDGSIVRRGGPSCHRVHGTALAINAGNAAYFLALNVLRGPDGEARRISDERALRIYSLYGQAMRAGHAGQSMDLAGFADLMPRAVEDGAAAGLERRVLAMHRLKSAIPASALARVGAIAGGGSDTQVEALGGYFENLGLAFQIMDDVVNLRGFSDNRKARGEDITGGKITMPVAKAMSMLSRGERQSLWRRLAARPTDAGEVAAIADLLESAGVLAACVEEGCGMAQAAWARLGAVFPPSHATVKLRAYSDYILRTGY